MEISKAFSRPVLRVLKFKKVTKNNGILQINCMVKYCDKNTSIEYFFLSNCMYEGDKYKMLTNLFLSVGCLH